MSTTIKAASRFGSQLHQSRLTFNLVFLPASILLVNLFATTSFGQTMDADAFEKRDRNGDGFLSGSELPKPIQSRLSRIDNDGDNRINLSEWKAISKRRSRQAKNNPKSNSSFQVTKDISYTNDSKRNPARRLDIYTPRAKSREPSPTLVFIHGGGLSKGDKVSIRGIGERFATDGFVVVSPNYRLAPDVEHPAFVDDVADAIEWTIKNIGKYGGDPETVFIAGGSAGGYLASLVTLDQRFLKERDLPLDSIRGLIAITALVDLNTIGPQRLKVMWGDDKTTVQKASPINHVTINSLPTLILYADGDTVTRKNMQVAFRKRFESVGHSDFSLFVLKNRKHETIALNMSNKDDPANRHIRKFIEQHLRKTRKPK